MDRKTLKIISKNNDYIKELSKLDDKKYRVRSGKFAFEGWKLFEEALKCGLPLESVLISEKAINDPRLPLTLSGYNENFNIIEVSNEVYDKISYEKSPEGVFCVSKALDKLHNLYIIYNGSKFDKHLMVLEGIRDPGNLGTIIRTASAFGIDCVILSDDCADIYNSKTIRAAMGALFRTRTARVKELTQTILQLRSSGFKVYGAALDTCSVLLSDLKIADKTAFVIGNEAIGISPQTLKSVDCKVMIPMENGTESLNAASAAAVIMWEMYRNK